MRNEVLHEIPNRFPLHIFVCSRFCHGKLWVEDRDPYLLFRSVRERTKIFQSLRDLLFRSLRRHTDKKFSFPVALSAVSEPFNPPWAWQTLLSGELIGGGLLLKDFAVNTIDRDMDRLKTIFNDEPLIEIREVAEARLHHLFN
jgi:hypothetical protein